jgi:hypothetical protein
MESMNDVDVDDVADELYALPPQEFTAARDNAATQAAEASARAAIRRLRKPTAAAHAVNAAVREQPETVDELLALADELRAAMAGRGGDLRELTERRRQLISNLVGADLAAVIRDDVTATFVAATADPQLGAAVRSGRLIKPLRYAGFGAMPDLDDAVATKLTSRRPPTATAKKSAPAKPAKGTVPITPTTKQAGPSAEDLDAARRLVLELSGAADDAQRRYDLAARAALEARAALDTAEKNRAVAHKAAREAHAAAEKARRALGRLERS